MSEDKCVVCGEDGVSLINRKFYCQIHFKEFRNTRKKFNIRCPCGKHFLSPYHSRKFCCEKCRELYGV